MSFFGSRSQAKRVLLVDDDLAILEVASTYLRARGFSVHIATSVTQAGVFLDTLRFDAVVTDLDIPPDGPRAGLAVAALAGLRRPVSHPLVVLWTGFLSIPLSEIREHGIDDFIVKGAVADLAELLIRRLMPLAAAMAR